MAPLLDRARLLLAAGPFDARPAEIAAVHAAIYPERDAVCQTCRGELGPAYFAIKRWAEAQPNFSTSLSPTDYVKKSTAARFKSDSTIYTPHGLGVAYSNTNLTNKAARDILANDPDTAALFDVLPGDADEDEQDLSPAQASAEQTTDQAPGQTTVIPADFDYAKLASAMIDELERRQHIEPSRPEAPATPEQPALTASTGGANDGSDTTNSSHPDSDTESNHDQDDEKPVRLSRMNKDQLVAAHTAEVGSAPVDTLTNDELREAIAKAREAKA